MAGLFSEMKRRNVFRAGATYVVAAWVVAQVVQMAADAFGAPDWVMQMTITLLFVGFVPVVVFSWVFELTPDGLRRESREGDQAAGRRYTARRLDVAVIVLLVVAIGLLLGDLFLFSSPGSPRSTQEAGTNDWRLDSIAVLPFSDFSPGRDQAWLGEGIAETLLHTLAQIEGLRVSARTSSFAYRDRDADIGTIGRELDVATVLEGSVQRAGDRLRVVAQLVRSDTQDHIFSKTFDREADDIFAIQDEIAAAVAEALMGSAAAGQARIARTTTDVYDLYMEGRQLWQLRDRESVDRAVELLEHAVSRDAEYAPARSELATALLFQAFYGDADLEDNRADIELHVGRALELDAEDAQAWATRGLLLEELGLHGDALEALHRAESLSPNDANIQVWLGNRYNTTGRFDRAVSHFERALELDPLNVFVRGRYATALGNLDRDDPRIERIARDTVRLFPDREQAWYPLLNLLMNQGRLDEAALLALDALRRHPDSTGLAWNLAGAFNGLGDYETADRWIAAAQARSPDSEPWSAFYMHRDPARHLELARLEYDEGRESALPNLLAGLRMNGRLEEAWALAEEHLAELVETDAAGRATVEDYNALIEGIWLARRMGDDDDVARRLTLAERKLQEVRDTGFFDDLVMPDLVTAAALGDRDRVLGLLPEVGPAYQNYVAMGLQHDPIFQPVADTPEARAIVRRAEQRRQNQLERLRREGPEGLFEPERA